MAQLTRPDFEALDKRDPLADFRDKFVIPQDHIYLDGNSLGVLPRATPQKMREVVEQEWGQGLTRSWNSCDWVNCQRRVGDKIAPIIGAAPSEVLVCDSTSVNLFKLAAAALRLNPGRSKIVTEAGNFPTDLYVLEGLGAFCDAQISVDRVDRAHISQAIDDNTAVLVLTHIHYKSGAMFDMAAITAQAKKKGALVLWDLSHSAGAVPVDLRAAGVDFAVGCGYKYLNGGPGAPAFLFVAESHQADVRSPLSGWFAHARPFDFIDDFEPAAGIDRFQCGTPSVLGVAALEVGVELMAAADMGYIREKSTRLGDLFIQLLEQHCPELTLVSPVDASKRGSHVSVAHPQGYAIMQALIQRRIIGDFRAPDILRFGFTPLYVRYVDVWDCVIALADILQTQSWNCREFLQRAVVT